MICMGLIELFTKEHIKEEVIRTYQSYGHIINKYLSINYDTGEYKYSDWPHQYVVKVTETNLGNVTVSIHNEIHGYLGSPLFKEYGTTNDVDKLVCNVIRQYTSYMQDSDNRVNENAIAIYNESTRRRQDVRPYEDHLSKVIKSCTER